jgi:NADH-quinone oxidoreductase subunit G
LARRIAEALRGADRPVIVSGTGSLSAPVIRAAALIARALCTRGRIGKLYYSLPESNSLGLALMGGRDLDEAFRLVREQTIDAVVILENDLYRRAGLEAVDLFLERAGQVIVLDQFEHATAAKADVALPSGTFAEAEGTLVNNEGRAQRFYQVFTAPDTEIQASWRWLRDLAAVIESRAEMARWRNIDDVTAALVEALPQFRRLVDLAPPASFRVDGMKIPRQSKAYSGRTAMYAHLTVHEPTPPDDLDSPLAFSMEGYRGPKPAPIVPQFWAPGWNSNQALNKFQSEVGGPLREETPGVRLIEGLEPPSPSYFTDLPGSFTPRPREWLLLPLHHIFGSEELGCQAPAIAERMPPAYLALNPDDAARARLQAGQEAAITVGAAVHRLPVTLDGSIPQGVAGLPLLPSLIGTMLPAWGRISGGQER